MGLIDIFRNGSVTFCNVKQHSVTLRYALYRLLQLAHAVTRVHSPTWGKRCALPKWLWGGLVMCLLAYVCYYTRTLSVYDSGADMWKRCSHPAESVEFCIQRYFDMLSSKMVGSKRSDHWIDRHLEFQYGRHDETLNITILGSKWPVALKFDKQGYFDMLRSTVD